MNDFLKNLFNFNKTDTNVIGVDIGSSSIKIVQLAKSKGKAILKTYGSLAIGPYAGVTIGQSAVLPGEKISEILIDLMKEANVTTTNAGVAIPLRSSLVSLIEMPNLSQSELQKMVPLEARKYIPVPITEVTMDWWVIPKDETRTFSSPQSAPSLKADKAEVLVVSIHNEVLSNYTSIIKNAGLSTSFFEIEMFAAVRSLIEHELSPIMVFDMGASATKLYLVERGVVKQSHIINKGSQDITISLSQGLQVTMEKAEKIKRSIGTLSPEEGKNIYDIAELTLDYIFSEAGSVLLSFEKKNHKSISRVYLTGGGVLMKGFLDIAKSKFQTDVVIGDPFTKIEVPAFLSGILKESGLDFAVATGLALRKLQEFL
ncbi:MAG: type IV pilus assembly protein PilM [bacterium]